MHKTLKLFQIHKYNIAIYESLVDFKHINTLAVLDQVFEVHKDPAKDLLKCLNSS